MSKARKPTRSRSYARNRRVYSRRGYEKLFESDGEYLLKLIFCVLLGSFWVKFGEPLVWGGYHINAIPVGLLLGLILVSRYEHFQADRKIWYVTLIVIAIISCFYPAGIVI